MMVCGIFILMVILALVTAAPANKNFEDKTLPLISMYKAMKTNWQSDNRIHLNRNEVNDNTRHKRRTNDRAENYGNQPSESDNTWSVVGAPLSSWPNSNLVCTHRGDHSQTENIEVDHDSSWTHSWKYGLYALAAFALPAIAFKAFILPLKLLIGLKALTLLNSLLLTSLLFKYKSPKIYYYNSSNMMMPMMPNSSSMANDDYVYVEDRSAKNLLSILNYEEKQNENL